MVALPPAYRDPESRRETFGLAAHHNLIILAMAIICVLLIGLAMYQGDVGSWAQLERARQRREEARQEMRMAVASCASERTPLLLVVPPDSRTESQKGLPSPALSGVTEIPPLQESLANVSPLKAGGASIYQQRRFSF
ncbi:hypothetical protein QBC42DRAFT_251809 [Cladorrhinum samala]|uniref:Uncharacterized protein n=1 Tax=Cladorrhinum samala TaxID=585594 RepID=A0AAV9HMW7_9PEZI|nr:hypothetical protein QBC42DRAFT_251809 [Cladorrhinum samala]